MGGSSTPVAGGDPITSADTRATVTQLLVDLSEGTAEKTIAWERLIGLVYDDLRRVAANLMRAERAGHTLQPTAIVHEAFLRLVDQDRVQWSGREQFFAVAARAMRRVLVDHARKRAADKRGGGLERVTLDEGFLGDTPAEVRFLDLNGALDRLAALDARMARVVELRIFAGLTMQEIASVLEVSKRTVDGDWSVAKKWLKRELAES
jgi:RNA polymerase sigma factor (TIGR02999 family)